MSANVEKALDRLIGVLPLKARQESCGPEIKKLHQKVLRSFVEQGNNPAWGLARHNHRTAHRPQLLLDERYLSGVYRDECRVRFLND